MGDFSGRKSQVRLHFIKLSGTQKIYWHKYNKKKDNCQVLFEKTSCNFISNKE